MEGTRYEGGRYRMMEKSELEILLEQPAIDFRQEKYDPLLRDLQSNILKHHKKNSATFYFLNFRWREKALELLQDLADHITSAKEQLEADNEENLNIYLTYPGYLFLEIPENSIPKEHAFRMGMNQRARLDKGEVQDSYKDENEIHAIILYASNLSSEADEIMQKITAIQKAPADHYRILFEQDGTLNNPMEEKYHFLDGISNPRFFPGAFASTKKAVHAVRPTDLSALGLVLHQDKGGNNSFSCGTYGVFSKFEIKEKALAQLIEKLRHHFGGSEKLAVANILGRFSDGTPLSLSQEPLEYPTNNFNYQELININGEKAAKDDRDGSRCPFHTHVRKSNPRNAEDENRRIVRRGMFYRDDGGASGLLFVSFQNSLEQQFEYILNNWILNPYMNTAKSDEAPNWVLTGQDILFSRKDDQYIFPETWNGVRKESEKLKEISIPEASIGFKGGLYFYAPSISFFRKAGLYLKFASRATAGGEQTKEVEPEVDVTLEQINQIVGPRGKNQKFIPGTEIKLDKGKKEAIHADKPFKFNKGFMLPIKARS